MKIFFLVITILLWCIAGGILWASIDPQLLNDSFFGLWRTRNFASAILLVVISLVTLFAIISKPFAFKYTLFLVQIVVAILLLEIIGQIGFINYAHVLGVDRSIITNSLGASAVPFLDESGKTYQDIATLWNLDQAPIKFHYKTDRRGFRNPSDPDEAMIYLLGDSIVVGATVPFNRTVAAQLQKNSGQTVLNIALIGLSVQEQHNILEKSNLPLNGRLVLQFIFEGNDLSDSNTYRKSGANSRLSEQIFENVRKNSFLNNFVIFLQRTSSINPASGKITRYNCEISGKTYEFRWAKNSFSGLEQEQDEIIKSIDEFSKYIDNAGGNLAVVFVPSKLRVLRSLCSWPKGGRFNPDEHVGPFRATILEWNNTSPISVLDLSPALIDISKKHYIPWFWGDTHWNKIGHETAAHEIANWKSFLDWQKTGKINH